MAVRARHTLTSPFEHPPHSPFVLLWPLGRAPTGDRVQCAVFGFLRCRAEGRLQRGRMGLRETDDTYRDGLRSNGDPLRSPLPNGELSFRGDG
jgi:hypothetical protein